MNDKFLTFLEAIKNDKNSALLKGLEEAYNLCFAPSKSVTSDVMTNIPQKDKSNNGAVEENEEMFDVIDNADTEQPVVEEVDMGSAPSDVKEMAKEDILKMISNNDELKSWLKQELNEEKV